MNRALHESTTLSKSEGPGDSETGLPLGLVQLHPWTPDRAPQVWSVCNAVHVGRASECKVRIEDGLVSRRHARLEPTEEGISVRDLDSRHGTFFEGRRISTSPVYAAPGAILRFGDSVLLVVAHPDKYEHAPHRLPREATGLSCDALAGPKTWEVLEEARRAGPLEHPVLILGESGTGKELIARVVHRSRPQASDFVAINVTAIPDGLFEAELFGHVRGAFTGATQARPGVFREASGGTLFLDEVGDLRLDLQAKLLRAVESRCVRPVGASKDVEVNPRLIAATSRDIELAVEQGTFRGDLFHRLSCIVIRMPPLRERREDILLLAKQRLADEGRGVSLSAAAAEQLALGRWSGNVRELHNAVVRAMLRATAEGSPQLLPRHLPGNATPEATDPVPLSIEPLRSALAQCQGNVSKAAQLLGVSRSTIYNYCAREGLDVRALSVEVRASSRPPRE